MTQENETINEEQAVEQVDDQAQDTPQSGDAAQDAVESAINDLGLDDDKGDEQTSSDDQPDTSAEVEPEPKSDDAQPEQKSEAVQQKKPQTDDEIEAEMLKGVRSERGRDRLQKMLAERKEARTQLESVQKYIRDSGLDAEGFANTMAIARMISSTDPDMQKKGLQALEVVRTELYKQFGVEAPGVDLLSDHKDLKQKVDDMELTREDALSIMRGRQVEAAQMQEAQRRQEFAAKEQELRGFGERAVKAFSARSQDPSFSAKVDAMQKYFAVPGRLQQFVSTHRPDQWEGALLWMYDNIAVQPTAMPRQDTTPITQHRARSTGTRVTSESQGSAAGVAALMDSLGL